MNPGAHPRWHEAIVMLPDAVRRVQAHYRSIAPAMEQVARVCYRILFERHPELRPLFPGDMDRQVGHLTAAFALICKNLDRLSILEGPLMTLGAQHAEYGARPEHYPMVCGAILDALDEAAPGGLLPRQRKDWAALLDHVSVTMIRGATGRGAMLEARGLTVSSVAYPTRPAAKRNSD